jgi:hypothetical protein
LLQKGHGPWHESHCLRLSLYLYRIMVLETVGLTGVCIPNFTEDEEGTEPCIT